MENKAKFYKDVVEMVKQHEEMARYLELALPFLRNVKSCSVYQDGQALLKKVQGK